MPKWPPLHIGHSYERKKGQSLSRTKMHICCYSKWNGVVRWKLFNAHTHAATLARSLAFCPTSNRLLKGATSAKMYSVKLNSILFSKRSNKTLQLLHINVPNFIFNGTVCAVKNEGIDVSGVFCQKALVPTQTSNNNNSWKESYLWVLCFLGKIFRSQNHQRNHRLSHLARLTCCGLDSPTILYWQMFKHRNRPSIPWPDDGVHFRSYLLNTTSNMLYHCHVSHLSRTFFLLLFVPHFFVFCSPNRISQMDHHYIIVCCVYGLQATCMNNWTRILHNLHGDGYTLTINIVVHVARARARAHAVCCMATTSNVSCVVCRPTHTHTDTGSFTKHWTCSCRCTNVSLLWRSFFVCVCACCWHCYEIYLALIPMDAFEFNCEI